MSLSKIVFIPLVIFLLVTGCASVEPEQSVQGNSVPKVNDTTSGSTSKLNDAAARSAAAQSRMDQAFSGGAPTVQQNQTQVKSEGAAAVPEKPAAAVQEKTAATVPEKTTAPVSNAPVPVITTDKNGKPNWVDKSDTVYDKNYYVSAVGMGNTRQTAEANAFGNLSGFFGQSVTNEIKSVETYKELIKNGSSNIVAGQETSQTVALSSSMNALIGAEIDNVWNDTKTRTYYAVAVMDKQKCAQLYSSLIDANLKLIDRLTSGAAKDSIDAVINYQAAAVTADANGVFATVLALLGGANRKSGLKTGADYRVEAKNLAAAIPVQVAVDKDSGGRIKSAFAGILSGSGFRTGNSSSRYSLNVKVKIDPVEYPGNKNKFSRYVIDADLKDTKTDTVLIPFNINDREGALTQSEADTRAYQGAEKKIKEEFSRSLQNYLSGLLPSG
ncbi:hypothetical protein AGMMS50212_04450 [Spirochaetia bacterium]|nr:hypothetical protein AGMMS50212_04450 [Spirochaetia bacterium]